MWNQELVNTIHTLWAERWDVLLFIVTIVYRKNLYTALAGGNGELQIDEIAKGILLLVFYASFRVESSRADLAHQVFSDTYWFAVLGSIGIIAGIKEWKNVVKNGGHKKDKTEGTGQAGL